jgi:transposase, IS30 family
MGRHYDQLSLDERCTIAQLREAGQSIAEIAADLDRAPSTVSRELKRNTGIQVGYKPTYANDQARARRWTGSRLERDALLRGLVLGQLRLGWSPEQIAGRLRQQNAAITISHESIYRFIYAQVRRTNDGAWRHYLPKGRSKRRAPGNRRRSCDDLIKRRVSIDLRPQAVEHRTTFGHWEADLMMFAVPGQAVLVTHERKSRMTLIARQPGKASQPAVEQLLAWFEPLHSGLRKSVTFDNGTEFAQHHVLNDELAIRTFFCDPHSPWQKGSVENTIGRLRRYLPRKTNLDTINPSSLDHLIAAHNNTPRKCLDFKTPAEVFSAKLLHFKRDSTPSLRSG